MRREQIERVTVISPVGNRLGYGKSFIQLLFGQMRSKQSQHIGPNPSVINYLGFGEHLTALVWRQMESQRRDRVRTLFVIDNRTRRCDPLSYRFHTLVSR